MNMAQNWFLFSGAGAALALLLPAGLQAAGCGQIKPNATDAMAAAPGQHKVILENDAVRVLEATIPLHGKEPPHTHFWPSVFFEQTSGLNEPWKTVKIRWSEGGPAKGYVSADSDRHNLLIELKNTDCQPASAAALPDTDAVKIHDPNMTVALEKPICAGAERQDPPWQKGTLAHPHLACSRGVFQPASFRARDGGRQENAAGRAEGIASDIRRQ
jgi:hypothetical protein